MTYTYIKKSIPGYYFRPEEPLTEENCDILGYTLEDFYNDKFVQLSSELIAFAELNPNANIFEIFKMYIEDPIVVENTLEQVILNKVSEINLYDVSSNVNSFYLNGIPLWLDKSTRVGLMNSLNIEKNAGREISKLWFGDLCISINCDAAIQMLNSLELYALDCYNQTAQHIASVKSLTNIEDVKNYDYTLGYPEKLSFEI